MVEKFKVPCPDCIGYAMCINKDEITCSILTTFYQSKPIDPKMRRCKSLYRHKLDAIGESLGDQIVIDWGYDDKDLWISLFSADDIY